MLKHVMNATVWLSLAAFGAGVMVPTPVTAQALRKTTKKVPPVYSTEARHAHLSGTVKMLVSVSPDGTVKKVYVLGGNPLFVAAAEEAVKQWKFEPATKATVEPVALKFENPS
jgi:TonB family protein